MLIIDYFKLDGYTTACRKITIPYAQRINLTIKSLYLLELTADIYLFINRDKIFIFGDLPDVLATFYSFDALSAVHGSIF